MSIKFEINHMKYFVIFTDSIGHELQRGYNTDGFLSLKVSAAAQQEYSKAG